MRHIFGTININVIITLIVMTTFSAWFITKSLLHIKSHLVIHSSINIHLFSGLS